MRYSLRNQDKISNSFGQDYTDLLIKSLDNYFQSRDAIPEHKMHDGYSAIFVPNAQPNTDSDFIFYIVGRKYDVLNLAYFSAVG